MKNNFKQNVKWGLGALIFTSLSLGLALPGHTASERNIVGPGRNCVAYKTHKTLAMVADTQIVGMNCNVSVTAVKTGSNYSAEIKIPISSFNSQERDRDKEVAKILKANVSPNLVFKVDPLPAATWESMLAHGSGAVHGTLYIGNQPHRVATTVKVSKAGGHVEVYGTIVSKFTDFGIKPPEVGPGGVIAKAADYLELHFNFLDSKVRNRSIVPGI